MSTFFDTNVLIHAQGDGVKADRARVLLAIGGVLSVQVLDEFAAIAHRKLGKNWSHIEEAIEDILAFMDPPLPLTAELHGAARVIANDHGFSFYDALIIAAALEAGCDTLLSENLQNGRVLGGLRIIDPFMGADNIKS